MSPPVARVHIASSQSDIGSSSYFTEFTLRKGFLYLVCAVYVLSVSMTALIEPYISLPCDGEAGILEFENAAFDPSPCRYKRFGRLLWVTRAEYSYARRLVASVVLGGVIGWERRQADRPAGIRTMSLVSLGSALFTICSTSAFLRGPMNWDASRVSAAIPSGVGFLGAGLIFKEAQDNGPNEPATHVVHGLTTAASVWLSAAVGIACGGELYFAASFGAAIVLLLLRFGPRSREMTDEDDHDHSHNNEDYATVGRYSGTGASTSFANLTKSPSKKTEPGETDSLVSESTARKSTARKRAALSTMV